MFYLPRLTWRRVSDHLFRWTQPAHMTDSTLDQLEGQPGLPRDLAKITSREEHDSSVWKSIPGFAKILLFLQTLIILSLSFWIYQEYLNNSFLQTYVNNYLQAGSFTAITLIATGSFTIMAMALYAKLRSTSKELAGILSTDTVGVSGSGRRQGLDTRSEQHLIEMIRKTTPIMNSGPGSGGQMPILRRVGSRSPMEEQRYDQ